MSAISNTPRGPNEAERLLHLIEIVHDKATYAPMIEEFARRERAANEAETAARTAIAEANATAQNAVLETQRCERAKVEMTAQKAALDKQFAEVRDSAAAHEASVRERTVRLNDMESAVRHRENTCDSREAGIAGREELLGKREKEAAALRADLDRRIAGLKQYAT